MGGSTGAAKNFAGYRWFEIHLPPAVSRLRTRLRCFSRDRSTNRNRRHTAEMTELRKIDVAAGKDTAGPAFAVGQSLAAPLLYRRCDPAELPFAVCTELEEAPGLIGQERAVEAVQFAMRMRRKGYNVCMRSAPAAVVDIARLKACCSVRRRLNRRPRIGVTSTTSPTRSDPIACNCRRAEAADCRSQ